MSWHETQFHNVKELVAFVDLLSTNLCLEHLEEFVNHRFQFCKLAKWKYIVCCDHFSIS